MPTMLNVNEAKASFSGREAAKFEQAVGRLMSEINAGAESAARDGWIDESDVLSEFGVRA